MDEHPADHTQSKLIRLMFTSQLKLGNDNRWLPISYVYFASSSAPLCVAKLSALFKHFPEAGRLLTAVNTGVLLARSKQSLHTCTAYASSSASFWFTRCLQLRTLVVEKKKITFPLYKSVIQDFMHL